MGWRKKMGVKQEKTKSNTSIQKVQNIQKPTGKQIDPPFVPSVPIVDRDQKLKVIQQKHGRLWKKAWKLADWLDDNSVPWPEREIRIPEYDRMTMRIAELEKLIKQGMNP